LYYPLLEPEASELENLSSCSIFSLFFFNSVLVISKYTHHPAKKTPRMWDLMVNSFLI